MVNTTKDLLVEIGTEELPPKELLNLVSAFQVSMQNNLDSSEIGWREIERFAAPRRLALLVRGVEAKQKNKELVRRGPSIAAAFDEDGNPTKAALGFARSCGSDVAALEKEKNSKGEWLCFRSFEVGKASEGLLAEIVEKSLGELPIPKRMRWGQGDAEFVRPVHWICMVFGDEPVSGHVLGVAITNNTRGHRFHHPGEISITAADSYACRLKEVGMVLASFEERRATIDRLVRSIAQSEGLYPEVNAALLDEVTALVEWPVAMMGRFDDMFLGVPPEVLIETMQQHQKYFPVRDGSGSLVSKFILVSNIDSNDPDLVRQGNERVIRPRFADAKFFWEQDLKQDLQDFLPRLRTIVYQERLGTIADKCTRVEKLAAEISERLGFDTSEIVIAAKLAKCDLVSAMVGEFPSLQGTMGRYYASESGFSETVSRALEEQYLPRFSGDKIPSDQCGQILAVADRLDTLVGIFGIGLRPTGTKDPYGLRRASISVIRILIESGLAVDLQELAAIAETGFPPGLIDPDTAKEVVDYVMDRLAGYYLEKGIGNDAVSAALAVGETQLLLLHRRIVAVDHFRALPEAQALAAANKRISNLLAKVGVDMMSLNSDSVPDSSVDIGRFDAPEEHQLWNKMRDVQEEIRPFLISNEFQHVLSRLATVREEVDSFFDNVMVNVADESKKKNRFALLNRLRAMFLQVADVSKLN